MLKIFILPHFLLTLLFFSSGQAQVFIIDNGTVQFKALATTVGIDSEFTGQGSGLNGKIDLSNRTFSFIFNLNTLKTGIQLRDIHMREDYLETDKYPLVKFDGKLTSGNQENEWVATGMFHLHGQNKEISIIGTIKENRIQAFWSLDIREFGIEVPTRFLVASLSPELKMSVDSEIKRIEP